MKKIRAKFIGDENDFGTEKIGIEEGKKYTLEIFNANFISRMRGFDFIVVLKVGGYLHQIPYSENELKDKWKFYRKGGFRI